MNSSKEFVESEPDYLGISENNERSLRTVGVPRDIHSKSSDF